MLTIAALKEFGADVDSGLTRCINNESLYLRLVSTVPSNDGFRKLKEAIAAKDFEAAFQAAHGLKGALNNLSLTPLCTPINEITELLRSRASIDFSPYLEEIEKQYQKLKDICEQ